MRTGPVPYRVAISLVMGLNGRCAILVEGSAGNAGAMSLSYRNVPLHHDRGRPAPCGPAMSFVPVPAKLPGTKLFVMTKGTNE